MESTLVARAGGAIWWRGVQLAVVKALALLRLLVLARLVLPADFGLFAIAAAAVGFASSVTDLGIVPALVQRREPSAREFNAGWTLGVCRGALLTVVMLGAAGPLAEFFDEPRAARVLQGLAILPVAQSLASIGTARLTRQLEFRALALLQAVEALAHTVIAVGLAPLVGVWALVIGVLGGALTSTGLSYAVAPHRPRFILDIESVRPLLAFGRWLLVAAALGSAADFVCRGPGCLDSPAA